MGEIKETCPLCKSEQVVDKGHGISCNSCGLWLGEGTLVSKFGGYLNHWNNRLKEDE